MEILTGVIQEKGSVLAEDETLHWLPIRGIDNEGYPEVIIDAKDVGGFGIMRRQSIKPFIGMIVEFVRMSKEYQGFNFVLLKSLNK